MADETDFIDLYRKLRVPAGCTLAEFKQAYRRHVAQWHPDRRRGGRADALAASRLQRLTAQYGAAMEFYRRHGRLPGAPLSPRMPAAVEAAEAVDGVPMLPVATASTPGQVSGHAARHRWLWLGAGLVIAVAAWSSIPAAPPREAEEPEDAVAPAPLPSLPSGSLRPGMGMDEVLAVEGEPTRRAGEQWEYGPSWVRFDRDGLSDWYSSPLRPLHAGSARAQR